MKILISAVTFGFLASVILAETFEGTVTYETFSESGVPRIEMKVKDGKMSFAPEGMPVGARVVIDMEGDESFIVIDSQRMVMPVNMGAAASQMGEIPSFEMTGETRDILGYEAKGVRYSDEDGTYTAWFTDELGAFMPTAGPLASRIPAGFDKAFPDGAFLLMVQEEGESAPTMKAVAVESGQLPVEMFVVPPGYRVMNMPNMPIPGLPQN